MARARAYWNWAQRLCRSSLISTIWHDRAQFACLAAELARIRLNFAESGLMSCGLQAQVSIWVHRIEPICAAWTRSQWLDQLNLGHSKLEHIDIAWVRIDCIDHVGPTNPIYLKTSRHQNSELHVSDGRVLYKKVARLIVLNAMVLTVSVLKSFAKNNWNTPPPWLVGNVK